MLIQMLLIYTVTVVRVVARVVMVTVEWVRIAKDACFVMAPVVPGQSFLIVTTLQNGYNCSAAL